MIVREQRSTNAAGATVVTTNTGAVTSSGVASTTGPTTLTVQRS